MIMVNIYQIKLHFSAYLEKIKRGETVVVCKHNVPVAELRAIPQFPKKARPIGLAKADFTISEDFFKPLPEDVFLPHMLHNQL